MQRTRCTRMRRVCILKATRVMAGTSRHGEVRYGTKPQSESHIRLRRIPASQHFVRKFSAGYKTRSQTTDWGDTVGASRFPITSAVPVRLHRLHPTLHRLLLAASSHHGLLIMTVC